MKSYKRIEKDHILDKEWLNKTSMNMLQDVIDAENLQETIDAFGRRLK